MGSLPVRTLLGGVLLMAACSSTDKGAPSGSGDSVLVKKPDSVQSDSDRIIGHDSAFGPKFTVDSSGNLVDLSRRTP